MIAGIAAATAGAAVQSTIGFGFAFIVSPTLALVRPEALPAAVLIGAYPLVTSMAWTERGDAHLGGAARMAAARLPGTIVGVWIVGTVSTDVLLLVVGALIVGAVAVTATRLELPLNPLTEIVAGVTSGVTGTTTGLGGPPLAILYQSRAGAPLRATLALVFSIGGLVSVVALAIGGVLTRTMVTTGVVLIPGTLAGFVLGRLVVRRLDVNWLRPAILLYAAAGGLVAIGRGLS